jgi:sugar/nucleoside kinase (ribokinase family)
MSAGALDLLVLGDCNPDLILSAPDLEPRFGQAETVVDAAQLTIGGSGAILACGAARLGLRTALAGVVGDDLFGRFMIDALTGRGVQTSGLIVDPGTPTGLTVILARRDDRAIITHPGAIAALTVEMIDRTLLRGARHLHVASFYLQRALTPGLGALFSAARRRGITTSVDPNWDPSESWDGGLRELLPEIDVLLPNAVEAMRIAGSPDPLQAACALSASGPLTVVKLGPAGAVAARQGEVAARAAPPAASAPAPRAAVVDAVGAGDAFDAGFLAGRLAGEPLERSLALACACGALSTRAAGGTAAQATMAEARALID